jgi:hypothetical protein
MFSLVFTGHRFLVLFLVFRLFILFISSSCGLDYLLSFPPLPKSSPWSLFFIHFDSLLLLTDITARNSKSQLKLALFCAVALLLASERDGISEHNRSLSLRIMPRGSRAAAIAQPLTSRLLLQSKNLAQDVSMGF